MILFSFLVLAYGSQRLPPHTGWWPCPGNLITIIKVIFTIIMIIRIIILIMTAITQVPNFFAQANVGGEFNNRPTLTPPLPSKGHLL